VGETFRAQARVQKGTGKALGTEIAEAGFWRAFLDYFKPGVVRSKSHFSVAPRSVLLTVCIKDGILFKFFTVMRWGRFEHLPKY